MGIPIVTARPPRRSLARCRLTPSREHLLRRARTACGSSAGGGTRRVRPRVLAERERPGRSAENFAGRAKSFEPPCDFPRPVAAKLVILEPLRLAAGLRSHFVRWIPTN